METACTVMSFDCKIDTHREELRGDVVAGRLRRCKALRRSRHAGRGLFILSSRAGHRRRGRHDVRQREGSRQAVGGTRGRLRWGGGRGGARRVRAGACRQRGGFLRKHVAHRLRCKHRQSPRNNLIQKTHLPVLGGL